MFMTQNGLEMNPTVCLEARRYTDRSSFYSFSHRGWSIQNYSGGKGEIQLLKEVARNYHCNGRHRQTSEEDHEKWLKKTKL